MSDLEQLQRLFSGLAEPDRHALIRYAEFLSANGPEDELPAVKEDPVELPRPEEEKVIYAIRRLAQTYPMLNHDRLLRQSADLMSAHLVNGRPASDVIDELEAMFLTHYQSYLDE